MNSLKRLISTKPKDLRRRAFVARPSFRLAPLLKRQGTSQPVWLSKSPDG